MSVRQNQISGLAAEVNRATGSGVNTLSARITAASLNVWPLMESRDKALCHSRGASPGNSITSITPVDRGHPGASTLQERVHVQRHRSHGPLSRMPPSKGKQMLGPIANSR